MLAFETEDVLGAVMQRDSNLACPFAVAPRGSGLSGARRAVSARARRP